MIGKFFDVLFKYADRVKASGDMERLKIVHEIEDILQTAYDLGTSASSVIVDYKGRNALEKLVVSIPDIVVYRDKSDDTIWYELEYEYKGTMGRRRFDTPEEVIKYLIDFRASSIKRSMGEERKAVLDFIANRIENLRLADIDSTPKSVREVEK